MEQILWFGWFRADIIAQYGALFWRGLQMTVLVTLIGIVFGTALGLGLGLAGLAESRHSPAKYFYKYLLRWPSDIVLPQAFRRMLPPLGNNAIALLKDSSLISAIGLAELAYAARTVAGAYSRYWEPYLTISLMYWVLTLGLAYLVKKLEVRYGRGD